MTSTLPAAAVSQRPTQRHLRHAAMAVLVVLATFAGAPSASADSTAVPRSGWPLAGPITVARPFEPPPEPWAAGHRGVDLASHPGAQVLAAADGTVTFAGPVAGRSVVVISHGATRTTYEPVAGSVPVGTTVRLGDPIGVLQAGHCAPDEVAPGMDCLHWGWRTGDRYLDPMRLGGSGSSPDEPEPANRGRVRLVASAQRELAERRAAERAAALQAAAGLPASPDAPIGPAGVHGFVIPVPGPITSPYGMRRHPVLGITKLHDGTDFGAACGTPIRAPAAGRVAQVFFNAGYGNRLMIDHGIVDGRRVISGYNHASAYSASVGQAVAQGQVIGAVGSTGYSTGCHLHLMLWLDGQVVDPMTWW